MVGRLVDGDKDGKKNGQARCVPAGAFNLSVFLGQISPMTDFCA